MYTLPMRGVTRGFAATSLAWVALAVAGLVAPLRGQDHATVSVNNTRAVPVVVYLERGQFDLRLGMVAPHTTAMLNLPSTVTQSETIRILVHPEGGRDLSTPDLRVKKGKPLDIYVPTNDEGFLPPPAAETIPDPGPGITTLTVENARDQQVVVFLEHGDFDTRVGTVPANEKTTFHLPAWLFRDERAVQIFVHPERGHDFASQTFELEPEAHLLVKVPAR